MLCTMPMVPPSLFLTFPLPSYAFLFPSYRPTALSPEVAPTLGSMPCTMPILLHDADGSFLSLLDFPSPRLLLPVLSLSHSSHQPNRPDPRGGSNARPALSPGVALTLGSTPSTMPMAPSSPPFNLRSTNLLFPPLHLPPSPLSIFPPLPPLHLPPSPPSPSSPLSPLSIFPPLPPLHLPPSPPSPSSPLSPLSIFPPLPPLPISPPA
ncbi:unnamed protein product [Closterium sp. Naga37s-1]|nr:unnamed protein product [Closterium sp. Naga37s-1]